MTDQQLLSSIYRTLYLYLPSQNLFLAFSFSFFPAQPVMTPDPFAGSLGYLQHVLLCSGPLWKRVTSGTGGVGSLLYRRRYFELSNIQLTYYSDEKKSGVSEPSIPFVSCKLVIGRVSKISLIDGWSFFSIRMLSLIPCSGSRW